MKIIPVINKIDLSSANVELVEYQIVNTLKLDENDIISISAKNNVNIDKLFDKIINGFPMPKVTIDVPQFK